MAKIAKTQRRWLRERARALRQRISLATPLPVRRLAAPLVHRLDSLFIDHGIFRVVYPNRHALGPKAWRSAQPTPGQIARYARQGIGTIVNLRGPRYCGSYWLELEACRRHGIALIDFQLRSRAAPQVSEIHALRALLERIEYPILVHCKSGADRVGLFSVLYMHYREGVPVEVARHQLHWCYGHVRAAQTGILDRFFDSYLEYSGRTPITFTKWIDEVYDPVALRTGFKASRSWSFFVDKILRRE